ncbi:MAG: thiamine phosphate synthase [Spirochaetes bacterium]|nr:MAG: thiamine phosphate synthase [Spirochaetota bacterium]
MKRELDVSLYLVTDRKLSGGRPLDEIVKKAVEGGVTIVQLREKDCSTREYLELACSIKRILTPLNIPLIINDRVDIALAAGAEGVHLGQSDMPYRDARRIMGAEAIIGLSVETMEDAREAESLDVDYLGVSPIFFTSTKTDTKSEWGIEGLRKLRVFSRHKLVAIGSIKQDNASEVIAAGADGVAVVSAICSASDPKRAAEELKEAVLRGRSCEIK